jgi:multiple sugar transport system permease protein
MSQSPSPAGTAPLPAAHLRPEAKRRSGWRRQEEQIVGYLLLLPAILLVAAVTIFPLVRTLLISLTNQVLSAQTNAYVGLHNYQLLVQDFFFKKAYGNTWVFSLLSVLGETILGMALALVMSQRWRLRGWLRAAVLIPWAIPDIVSARLWSWLYDGTYGLLNFVLRSLHLVSHNVTWLGDPQLALPALIVADVWKTTPFMALLLLAGLQSIPAQLYEAAAVDGASRATTFRRVTLPLVTPVLVIAVLIRFLGAFQIFTLIYVTTEGGPAGSTETISTYTYKTVFSATQFGYGAAMAVVLFTTLLVATLATLVLFGRRLTQA